MTVTAAQRGDGRDNTYMAVQTRQGHTALPFVHGPDMDRIRAEMLLRRFGPSEGLFLVRTKDAAAGVFALSLLVRGQPVHHLLERTADGFAINSQPFRGCPTLMHLVHGLRQKS